MSLNKEIEKAKTEIVSDGYDMSIGEILNLYQGGEIIINPEFQRYFRWDITRKSRFMESILLKIPTPPIFVYQNKMGVWELIDGLQRLSTLLEFVGILKDGDGNILPPLELSGTKFLPSLDGATWDDAEIEGGGNSGIGLSSQLQIKRARFRVEILKKESDPKAKFELFQRLNTGGSTLTEQEVRNCVAIMLNKDFYNWVKRLAAKETFLQAISISESAIEKRFDLEVVLRFLAFRNIPYVGKLDVHEYLDEALIQMASDKNFDYEGEERVFIETFSLLATSLKGNAFKKYDTVNGVFKGQFLLSLFEVVAIGVSHNLSAIERTRDKETFLKERCAALWDDDTFLGSSGAGVRGSTRLKNLIPHAEVFFRP